MTLSPEDIAAALGRHAPTPEQSAIISSPVGPRLVIAGAGSGKTETIAARVVYLVVNGVVTPDQVLGLTFTRKAAAELGQRIRQRLAAAAREGLGGDEVATGIRDGEPHISTYHAFAGRLIDEFGPLAGIPPADHVLTATEGWQLARSIVSRWDRDLDIDRSAAQVTEDILAISSALADHLADPDDLGAELERIVATIADAPPTARQTKPIHSTLESTYQNLADRRGIVPLVRAFTEAKRDKRVVDFADQMQLAAELVTLSPRVGEALRGRYGAVLLDEYQDTGHAQRIILRALFGRSSPAGPPPAWQGFPVMAVGDPVQSIYSWRGASASNLPRFSTDFPQQDGAPAAVSPLLVSFRNDRRILDIANVVSAPLRLAPVEVGELQPAASAGEGRVTAALHDTVGDENRWLAERLAAIFRQTGSDSSIAVLVRRRAAMGPIAAALRDYELPVDIVGVGGLVDEPEVADVIAMLRMVVDHESGAAAVRLLTGARLRLGIADLAALSRRARALHPVEGRTSDTEGPMDVIRRALADAVGGEDIDQVGLVSALVDPGDPGAYSPAGAQRIAALAADLRRLRGLLSAPLGDLIAEIVRTLHLDVEVGLTVDGRAHLDAFDEVVAQVAASGAGPIELLDYLETAGEREDGLAPGATAAPPGRIQILTVHSAKGLEWDVVALPQLCQGVFPSDRTSVWLTDASLLPPTLRGDRDDLPDFTLPAGADQGQLAKVVEDHRAAWRERQLTEERRLFYVAVTRARHQVLLSAHHWNGSRKTPSGPSPLLAELADHPERLLPDRDIWLESPTSATNPELDNPVTGIWPQDPLGSRRKAMEDGAALVRATQGGEPQGAVSAGRNAGSADVEDAAGSGNPASPGNRAPVAEGAADSESAAWARDMHALLSERDHRDRTVTAVPLPEAVSVSALVELAADPQRLAARLRRPLPQAPAPQARRGTAFHSWLEHHFGGDPLLDLAELPGAHDRGAAGDGQLADLVDAFLASPWAARTPIAVEVPFVTRLAGLTVRGRIDAVFAEPDGGVTVVDWKTGAVPGPDRAEAIAIQLTAYRLAYARLAHLPLESVSAAFYYVSARRTVTPPDLLDADGLEQLVTAATVSSDI